jgi:diazepam-binding inhibitor (GABA receptor modulator, acyl-CoA-binding protein)
MSDLKARFDAAVAESKLLTKKPDNATLLRIYALYKQASVGDVSGDRPDMFDRVAVAKYDAWDSLEGMTCDSAMQGYVDLIATLRTA